MSGAALAWLVTWQAVVLTAVSTVLLRLATRTNASTRYLAWWVTLVGVLLLAVTSWSWPLVPEYTSARVGGLPTDLFDASPGWGQFGFVEIRPVPLWFIGIGAALWATYSGRRLAALVGSIVRLRIVKQRCAPVPPLLEQRLPLWMSVRHEGRSARLCLSEDVATGCMLGLGPPVIALPQGLVAALANTDLDRVVLHEYGHVQRRDDWTTLAQASIEALLGWHPSIWWIGRSLRLEREVACDDQVIDRMPAPRDYASCLTRVAGLTLKATALPLASRALRSRRELIGRVERLLDPMRNVAVRPIRPVLTTGTLALASVVVLLGQIPPVVAVGVTDTLLTLPVVGFDAPPVMPRVASHWVGPGAWATREARVQIANVQSEELSAPPRSVNQTTLLEHAELSALRGLAPLDSLRPAFVRHVRPVLRSSEFAVDTEFAFPMNVPIRKSTEFRGKYMATDTGPGPWGRVAYGARAVGVGASYAGAATAAAFQTARSSIARAFVGSR